jgi:hypothetical protein
VVNQVSEIVSQLHSRCGRAVAGLMGPVFDHLDKQWFMSPVPHKYIDLRVLQATDYLLLHEDLPPLAEPGRYALSKPAAPWSERRVPGIRQCAVGQPWVPDVAFATAYVAGSLKYGTWCPRNSYGSWGHPRGKGSSCDR